MLESAECGDDKDKLGKVYINMPSENRWQKYENKYHNIMLVSVDSYSFKAFYSIVFITSTSQ